jgi:pimeloyl-ACP methyl ester carboxylesterase
MSLYSTPDAKKSILDIYQRKLDSLHIDYYTKDVETSFGNTHLIVTGDAKNPPLLLVHGSNGCAPIALEVYPNLSQKYQVFAIDVLAQPNRSAETRLSMKDNTYGKWMHEVLHILQLKEVTLVGFSLGGLIILKTLLHQEKHVKEVFLTAPAFIVNGNPLKAIFRLFIPMKRYMYTQKPYYLEQFLKVTFSEKDSFALEFLSKVLIHFKMDFTPVPVIKTKEAQQIKTPITLISAGKDLLFPGKKMLKRAKKIFPSLIHTHLLEDSLHVQTKLDNKTVEQLILGEAE